MVETKSKKKAKRKVSSGVAHIKASFNNTIINIADSNGETCLLYTSPSPRDRQKSRMPSSA